jgi:hypothetical protein
MAVHRAVILIFMTAMFTMKLFSTESGMEKEMMKGRDISPIPDTDERIDGYRKNYKKVKGSHIQFPSKYNQNKLETVEKQEPQPVKKQEQPEVEKPVVEKPVVQAVEKPVSGYTGGIVDGMREGIGKLVLENGDIYEGNWKKGQKSGHGIYLYSSGLKYNGSWKEDKMDGEGSLIFPDGSFYYGNFQKGAITGTGTFRYSDGAVYEGGWKDGKWNGAGVFKLSDGRSLKAVFANHQVVEILKDEKTENNCGEEQNDENN